MNLVVRWNPINHLFDGSFFPTLSLDDDMSLGSWRPVVDIYENEDTVVVKAELPGVDKKDIKVDLKDGVLTLTGPAEIDPDKIKAEFKDGVLKVEIPKPEEQKPKKIAVH
jgi:HSP20 family protein